MMGALIVIGVSTLASTQGGYIDMKLLKRLMWGSVALGAVLLALGFVIGVVPLIWVGIGLIGAPLCIALIPYTIDIVFHNNDSSFD